MIMSETSIRIPSNDIRFQMELEFIQCLASPVYLNFLAINRYFDRPAFMNYLKYLEYWRKPEYAKYIVFPHALAFLEMIQHEKFQKMIIREDFMTAVHAQQFYHWQYYLNNRQNDHKIQEDKKDQEIKDEEEIDKD